ncbi:MAG: insulinase family protein [Verrucomicrobiota bacterium]
MRRFSVIRVFGRASKVLAIGSIALMAATVESVGQDELLPVDERVTVGTLDNGLRYYVRHNGEPEGRGYLRLVVHAGSMQEDERQRGLARFIEHMAFFGTERFSHDDIVNFVEGAGMRWGDAANAYTGYDETVYTLNIPLGNGGVMDRAFQLLADWASGVTFDPLRIEQERAFLMEERRARLDLSERISEKRYPLNYYESRYARRNPLGSMIVMRNAPRQRFLEYYETWYRPNLMSIIAVGDFNPEAVEARIKAHFGELKNPENEVPREFDNVPGHEETLYSVVTDPEITVSSAQVLIKEDADPEGRAVDYRTMLTKRLFMRMMNSRLEERSREAEPPFVSASVGRVSLGRKRMGYIQNVTFVGEDFQRGLSELYAEVGRVARDGFTDTEFKREKANSLRGIERALDELEETDSILYVEEFTRAFLTGEPIPGIAREVEMTREFYQDISIEEVNAVAEIYLKERDRVVHYSTTEEAELPQNEDLLAAIESAKGLELGVYQDFVDADPLVSVELKGGEIVKSDMELQTGVYDWTLDNGIRVLAKPTNLSASEVLFEAFSPGGHSLYQDDVFIPAYTATAVLGESGLGRFNAAQLEKRLAGLTAFVNPYLRGEYEGLRGAAAPRDLDTLFELIYLQCTEPRFDRDGYEGILARTRVVLENRFNSPAAVFQDAIEKTLFGDQLRSANLSEKMIQQMDGEMSYHLFKHRFEDMSDFTFVFVGGFDPDVLKKFVEKYLGSLPGGGRVEGFRDEEVRPRTGKLKVDLERGLEERARVRVLFTGEGEWSLENRYRLAMMRDYLHLRLRSLLREGKEGVYDLDVFANLDGVPYENYSTGFAFSCDPDEARLSIDLALGEIIDLHDFGPDRSLFRRVKEGHLRQFDMNIEQNRFWLSNLVALTKEGRDPSEIYDLETAIFSLRDAEFQKLAKTYFSLDNILFAVMTPEER